MLPLFVMPDEIFDEVIDSLRGMILLIHTGYVYNVQNVVKTILTALIHY
jgi:hypothetical protein